MAAPSASGGSRGRLGFLMAELEPRWKEARYSLHLLRKSPLAMVGAGIIAFFAFVAVFGPVLAPYAYQYNGSEKNCPPWNRCVISRDDAALNVTGPGWTPQADLASWLSRADEVESQNVSCGCYLYGLYVSSFQVNDTLLLRRFQLGVSTDQVVSVSVKIKYNSTRDTATTTAAPGNVPDISMSWDNGTTWSAVQRPPLRFDDADDAYFTLDFTNATSWDSAKLNDTNFVVRIVHAVAPGFSPGGVGIDYVHVLVNFQGVFHSLGTTVEGEDVFTGLLLGARISMRIGIIVVVVATLIGSLLGALAGYYGGVLDELVMRITDVFLSIPGLVLALAVAAALGRNLDTIMYALIVVYWPPYTRLVRGQALSVRENLYIEASRATGASEGRVVLRHVLPNAISPILVQSSLDIGSVVLVAAGLSFLGLGAQPGTPEWGLMVSTGFSFFPAPNWWQVTFSGLMIFLFVMGFNLVGDGARDILDPRLRR